MVALRMIATGTWRKALGHIISVQRAVKHSVRTIISSLFKISRHVSAVIPSMEVYQASMPGYRTVSAPLQLEWCKVGIGATQFLPPVQTRALGVLSFIAAWLGAPTRQLMVLSVRVLITFPAALMTVCRHAWSYFLLSTTRQQKAVLMVVLHTTTTKRIQ